ncbi:MAG: ubiquinol-cytochrome C chaperone family protein, partial [Alphaproteobacteria bacterium]
RLAQGLFDAMFDDMDHGLRELGVGDLGVARRVKTMAKAFYGRIAAYDAGLAGSDDVLAAALARNLFGTVVAEPYQLAAFCAYLRGQATSLAGQAYGELSAGLVRFLDAETIATTR